MDVDAEIAEWSRRLSLAAQRVAWGDMTPKEADALSREAGRALRLMKARAAVSGPSKR